MLNLFIGTLIIVLLCCLAMGIGQVIDGRSMTGGCGNKPAGTPRCEACPKRKNAGDS